MKDRLVALLIGLVTVGWLLGVEGSQGIGRDEAQYFRAGEHYWGWFESGFRNLGEGRFKATFSRAGIDAFWGDNPEHPPVMKTLSGISWRLFHRCHCPSQRALHPIAITGRHVTLPLFARESTAFRFPAILMAGLGAALLYLFARQLLGVAASVAASVFLVAEPHYFFHAQISCFDAPITTMAIVVGFAYWKSLRSPRWGILCGLLYGLALGTKHNAWLMPFFLVAHYLWMRRRDFLAKRIPPIPLGLLSMLVLGLPVLIMLWPYLWPDPTTRLIAYFKRHLEHEHYNFEYLGINWNLPPKEWDLRLLRMTFPLVSTLFTVPVTTLVLAVIGAVVFRREVTPSPGSERATWLRPGADLDRAPGAFLFFQIVGPMAVIALPSTPIFGGVKHFMPAMPWVAVVAAAGLTWLTRVVGELIRAPRVLPAALAGLTCLPAVVETERSHPDGLSHYNLLAGGFAGGASLGMNRQFWGYSVLPMLPWMQAHAPASNRIYWHDVLSDALTMYARDGRLRMGMGNVGAEEAAIGRSDLGIVIHEKHFTLFEGQFWQQYGTTQPVYVRTREGVPLVTAYRRPGTP